MKLFLFDIDGTILHAHGSGRRGVELALERILGRPINTEKVRFSGKTDPQILQEVLLHSGFSPDEINLVLPQALDAYLETMPAMLSSSKFTVMPGILALLQHLHQHPLVHLGLITGNLEPLAYLKLRAVGLDHFFRFGAFGSDSAIRDDLPAIAVQRAHNHTGHAFTGKDVVIIGDTEHDICCGRGIGATSIGVCTGSYSRDDLAPLNPDVLLDDLTDLHSVLIPTGCHT